MEKISTRGGVRPAVVASGDMMTLRPVGATIGPADLVLRAAPRSGRFAAQERMRCQPRARFGPQKHLGVSDGRRGASLLADEAI